MKTHHCEFQPRWGRIKLGWSIFSLIMLYIWLYWYIVHTYLKQVPIKSIKPSYLLRYNKGKRLLSSLSMSHPIINILNFEAQWWKVYLKQWHQINKPFFGIWYQYFRNRIPKYFQICLCMPIDFRFIILPFITTFIQVVLFAWGVIAVAFVTLTLKAWHPWI